MATTEASEYLRKLLKFLFGDGTLAAELMSVRGERPSAAIRRHGYPFGYAKNRWNHRDQLSARLGKRLSAASDADKLEWVRIHESVVHALELERILGSFNRGGVDRFPAEQVDRVADNLLLWIDSAGFRCVAKDAASSQEPLPEVPFSQPGVYFDHATGTIVNPSM